MHPLRQAIWGDIWKHTAEKSQTNATNVIMHPLRQTVWGHIWRRTVEKSLKKCNQCDYASSDASTLRRHMKTHSGEKSTVWFCILSRTYASIYPDNFWKGMEFEFPDVKVQQLENSAIYLHRIWIYLMLKKYKHSSILRLTKIKVVASQFLKWKPFYNKMYSLLDIISAPLTICGFNHFPW